MADLDKSLATLVKYNNGFFKSDKQAKLFHSKAKDGVFYSEGGSVHGNGYRLAYHLDADGVTQVEKITRKDNTVTWTRDTTDAWKEVNKSRNEAKQLGAWLNKAQKIVNDAEQNIVPLVTQGKSPDFLVKRVARLKNMQTMIDQARARYDQIQSDLLKKKK